MKKVYGTINKSGEEIDGIIVTHEHVDHIQSLGNLSKKFNIPVYATSETFDAMPKQIYKLDSSNIKKIKPNKKFTIGNIDIVPFPIPHDAANPCGFTLYDGNKKISIATDIGHMNKNILNNIDGSNFILLEANYDENVLKYTKYPYKLKTRIAGPNGHLSNKVAGQTINYLINSGLKRAILGHLSKESNFPELAYQTVIDELISNGTNIENFSLSVADRSKPGKLIHI